jgi:Protein of unknown function (DUF2911)
MNKAFLTILPLALAAALSAQQRVSPHEKVSVTINGAQITIEYGRPYMKGRKIMGGLVPYGQVWRTGADEATTLTTTKALDIAGLKVPAGSYALFTLPDQNGWKLIVNKTAKQWGAFNYDQSKDLGRTDMTVGHVDHPVEEFTITLASHGGNHGILKMEWENTAVTAPFTVE